MTQSAGSFKCWKHYTVCYLFQSFVEE